VAGVDGRSKRATVAGRAAQAAVALVNESSGPDPRLLVARVRLSTRANDTLALPGETCERVPASSLPWLIEQGLVGPAEGGDQ